MFKPNQPMILQEQATFSPRLTWAPPLFSAACNALYLSFFLFFGDAPHGLDFRMAFSPGSILPSGFLCLISMVFSSLHALKVASSSTSLCCRAMNGKNGREVCPMSQAFSSPSVLPTFPRGTQHTDSGLVLGQGQNQADLIASDDMLPTFVHQAMWLTHSTLAQPWCNHSGKTRH